MNRFSKLALKATTPALKSVTKTLAAPAIRPMSTLLDRKELAEETKFIRQLESKRQEELRAKLESILALEDHSEEKKELVDLLDKKTEDSFVAKYGLNDWKVVLPLALFLGTPAVKNEIILIDAEFQLTASFVLFVSVFYAQVGPMISKALEEYGNNIQKQLEQVDQVILDELRSSVTTDELALSVEEDFRNLFALTDQLAIAQADILNRKEEYKYREAIVKKLDALVSLEDSASSAIRNRMVAQVKAAAVQTIKTDKKIQEEALNQAIAVLAGGANAKLGKDIVGGVFASTLTKYREEYAKKPAGSDEILVQLEKDIAAIAVAPTVEGKGGNVYDIPVAL